jgi:hypothetical protein
LSKLITQQQQKQQQQEQQTLALNTNTKLDSVKYRNLNEQIFNELITFKDTSYLSNTAKASNLISNMKKSLKTQDTYSYDESKQQTDNTSNKSVLISVPINTKTTTISPAQNMSRPLDPLNDNLTQSIARTNLSSIINSSSVNTNLHNQYDSGVYNESSRKSNKSTSYYSDISIVVYDNVTNISSSINSGVNSALLNTNDANNNNKLNTNITTSSTSLNQNQNTNDLVVVSVSKHQQNRTSIISASNKSVNDFTGSIIAADRTNYFNKQQQIAKLNRPNNNNNDSLYSNVIKRDQQQRNRSVASPTTEPYNAYLHHERIPIVNQSLNEPTKIHHESYETYRDSILNSSKKRSASEQVSNHGGSTNSINIKSIQINYETKPEDKMTSVINVNINKKDHNNDDDDDDDEKEQEEELKKSSKPVAVIVNELNSKFDKDNLIVSPSISNSGKHQQDLIMNNKIIKVNTTTSLIENANICNNKTSSSNLYNMKLNNYTRDSGQIEKRLLELEQIAKSNIEQLEKFEQKYSSNNTNNNKNNNNLFEIPISIQLNTNNNNNNNKPTNNLDKQIKLLEEINLKPAIKQRYSNPINTTSTTTTTPNNNNNLTTNLTNVSSNSLTSTSNTKINLIKQQISSNSSSSTASSTSSITTDKQNKSSLQTSIDIEIYNLEPKALNPTNISESSRQTLTIMPRANRRSKQKPFKIECTDLSITKQQQQQQFKTKTIVMQPSPNNYTAEVSKLLEKDDTCDKLAKLEEEQQQHQKLESSSNEQLNIITKTDPESTTNDESANDDDDDECYTHKKQSISKKQSTEDLPATTTKTTETYSLLCGSLDIMTNKEKIVKRRKLPHHRHSHSVLNQQQQQQQETNEQQHIGKSKREPLVNRRDRRARHTIPLLAAGQGHLMLKKDENDKEALGKNDEVKEEQENNLITRISSIIEKEQQNIETNETTSSTPTSLLISSDDEETTAIKDISSKLKQNTQSFENLTENKVDIDDIKHDEEQYNNNDSSLEESQRKVIEWNNNDETNNKNNNNIQSTEEDAYNSNAYSAGEEQALNSFSANEQTFSDCELSSPMVIACSTEINNLTNENDKTPMSSLDLSTQIEEEFKEPQTLKVELNDNNPKSGSKSDSETIDFKDETEQSEDEKNRIAKEHRYSATSMMPAAATAVTATNTIYAEPMVIRSLRKKHDSTDTLDSASSYEIRFERPHFSIDSKLDLEDKNIMWKNAINNIENYNKKKEEEQQTVLATTPIINITNDEMASNTNNDLSINTTSKLNTDVSSSSSFRSVEVSPKSNINETENDEIICEKIEIIKSITQMNNALIGVDIDQAKELNSIKLDVSSSSDSDNTNNDASVSLLTDQIEIISENKQQPEPKPEPEQKPVETEKVELLAAAKPVVVFDDGYGSTASMKNATNESCSSIDDTASEISLSSITTNNNKMMKKIVNKKLESLLDDSDNNVDLLDNLTTTVVFESESLTDKTLSCRLNDSELDEITLIEPTCEQQKQQDESTSEIIIEKTISYTKNMESKQPVEISNTETAATTTTPNDESNEFILIEQLENSMKIVELEPLAASQITIDLNETNKNITEVQIKLEQSVMENDSSNSDVIDSNVEIIKIEDIIKHNEIEPVEKVIKQLIDENQPIVVEKCDQLENNQLLDIVKNDLTEIKPEKSDFKEEEKDDQSSVKNNELKNLLMPTFING